MPNQTTTSGGGLGASSGGGGTTGANGNGGGNGGSASSDSAFQIPVDLGTALFPQYGNTRAEATVTAATNTRPEKRVELRLYDIKVHGNGSFGWVCAFYTLFASLCSKVGFFF